MRRYTTTFADDGDDDEEISIPQFTRRIRKEGTQFIKAEFNIPENYRDFQRAGIPSNAPELLEEFLRQFPSHEEIARWEMKGLQVAKWLNTELYETERLCLRVDVLVKNFDSLENTEVLLNQVKSTASVVEVLQVKLDDQLLPWLTKSNLHKHRFSILACFLIIGSFMFFVKNGSSFQTQIQATPPSVTKTEPSFNR